MRLRTLLILITTAIFVDAEPFDVIVRNGHVIDGTGKPAQGADIGIRAGRIAAVGEFSGDATIIIDANGLIVAPGFIDVHTHAENILEIPSAHNFAHMGVTTLVLGNCGSSSTDLKKFFAEVESTKPGVNIASLIGHGSVRSQIMGGSFMRPPTSLEIRRMKNVVKKAMDDGALGMSTGLIYLPGVFAKTEELIALAEVVSTNGGIYASHMRSEGDEIFSALEEVFAIARQADLPAHISHIKLGGQRNWNQSTDVIELINDARESGLRITQDQYAYTASSTGIGNLIPEHARAGGKFTTRMSQPGFQELLIEEMMRESDDRGTDFSYAVIASFAANPALNGMNIPQAAKTVRDDDSVEAQIRLILDIQLKGGASGVFHSINEEDLRSFMSLSNTMFAADSSIREWKQGAPHPRGYGNNARILRRYVVATEALTLEQAIRRMTSLPANTFGIQDRGVIREGAWADIVILDPNTVSDRATFAEPHQFAKGFHTVMVNGEVIISSDRITDRRPGQVVRRDK